MLAFEVVCPGGSLSMLLLPCILGEIPVGKGILAGDNGSGSKQL
jgi:hypothetical protein